MTLLLMLMQVVASVPPAASPEGDEIVVVARQSRCAVQLRGRELSKRELERHIREWAQGAPVRVAAPDGASHRCLSRILFRLSDRGVRTIEFVDPAGTR